MRNNINPGMSLYKKSRYYLDPSAYNGEVKILKQADPEKLAKVIDAKKKRIRNDFMFPFNGHLSNAQILKIRNVIIL